MSQWGVASRRHRDVFATSSRRHHYGGFMNPSFEPFVDPPDGFHDKPGTPSKAKDNFHRQRLVWRVNPECNFLFLRRPPKKPIFGFGRRKIFLGGRKSYLAAEHHNEAAPKKKKGRGFSEKYCSLGARRKSRFLVLGAEIKKKPPKKKCGGRNVFGGGRKSYLAAEHHNETAPKK